MTIAVAIMVNDGIVLASDSTVSLGFDDGANQQYHHANKVFNLYKGEPIGAMFYGQATITQSSIETLAKDFRKLLMREKKVVDKERQAAKKDKSVKNKPWIDPKNFDMNYVAEEFCKFLIEDRFKKEYAAHFKSDGTLKLVCPYLDAPQLILKVDAKVKQALKDKVNKHSCEKSECSKKPLPIFGMIITGYGTEDDKPRVYDLITGQNCGDPKGYKMTEIWITSVADITFKGAPDAINRLLGGFSLALSQALLKDGKFKDVAEWNKFVQDNPGIVATNIIADSMPIQDTIDLAEFLVNLTKQYIRFNSGPKVVGGPIEIGAITKHEGFKWAKRKHYYDESLNNWKKID